MASVLWLPLIFISATCWLYILTSNAPSTHLQSNLKFPGNLDELKSVAKNLSKFYEGNGFYVYLLFISAYIYKQTFAIPGSVFLNLLAGALFGVWIGFPLTCLLTAIGASFCFMLSRYFGRSHVTRWFPEKIAALQNKVEENEENLFYFLLFARIFPMTPNWLLNISSPIINIPLRLFFLSVFFGLMPYNFICVQTGVILSEISSLDSIFNYTIMGKLLAIAVATLLPGFMKKWSGSKRHSDK